ncbi:MAG: apolipoprotein N-acyltransferase [Ignavibacteria bacterium RBG_16_35_7]|nr:MAG: apolipoprotein N-acyltransferase [Ignavibacteria bacterium RBG_16_35_7]
MIKKNNSKKRFVIPLLIVGGIISGISYQTMQFYLAWFSLIPLFYLFQKANARQSFFYGLLYGIVTSSILFYWVFPVATRYSGVFTFYSILFYGAAVIYFSLYFALFGIGYKFLHDHSKSTILSGISVSAFYVLIELTRISLLPGLPWFHYNLAVTQAQNLWIIQWASIGGFYIIIFTIVLFNYLLTQFLIRKENILLKTALAAIIIFFWGGFLLSKINDEVKGDKINAVILNENISAETRWNDLTGDSLSNVFFKLNEDAVRYNPDLIIWSESAIPWKFEPDDEFIPKVLSITHRSKADHLLGILSPSSQNSQLVYNSAYLIKNDGRIADKYDKTILLDFLEKPFSGGLLSVLPFINTSRYDNILPGKSQNVIKSGKAQIGVLICNESLSEDIYARYIKAKANLLILMSNDAWFENTLLQMHHFYITRIEAVMVGRDVIINSNRGLIGIIRSNGNVESLPQSDTARILNCEAHLSSKTTIYSEIRNFSIPLYLLLTFFSIIKRMK